MNKNRILDCTGNEDESRRQYVFSVFGDGRVTSASMVKPTETDERDNERFNIQYETSLILKDIERKSR